MVNWKIYPYLASMKLRYLILWTLAFPLLLLNTAHAQRWQNEMTGREGRLEQFNWITEALRSRPEYEKHHKEMLKESLKIAQELKSDTLEAMVYTFTGFGFKQNNDVGNAWKNYSKALSIYERKRMYNKVVKLVYMHTELLLMQDIRNDSLIRFIDNKRRAINLATDHTLKSYLKLMRTAALFDAGRKEEAMEEYRMLTKMAEDAKDTAMVLSMYCNMAMNVSTSDSAIMWYKKGLAYYKPSSDQRINNNYGELLYRIGHTYALRDNATHDSALYYYKLTEQYADYMDAGYLNDLYNEMGEFFGKKGETDLALKHYRIAASYAQLDEGQSSYLSINNLVKVFIKTREFDSARYYLDIGKQKLSQGEQQPRLLVHYYTTRADYYAASAGMCYDSALINYHLAFRNMLKTGLFTDMPALTNIFKSINCTKSSTVLRQRIASEVLAFCDTLYPTFKRNFQLMLYSRFLREYAEAHHKYGNKERALHLYRELTSVLGEMNDMDYRKGLDEAMVKYKSEMKDEQIEASRKINILLISGLVLLTLAAIVVVISQRKTLKLNKLISRQKQELEKQTLSLESVNRVKDRLFSVISHDLRSPLSSLVSFIQLLENQKLSPEEMAEYSVLLKDKLYATSAMMDNLLNWAHSQMDGYRPYLRDVDLYAVSTQVVQIMQGETSRKNIEMINKIPPGFMLTADVDMVTLILRNLLSNAIKFVPDHGRIELQGLRHNGKVFLSVSDTGQGVKPEWISRFNSPGENTIMESTVGTSGEKGTGLGLALSKNFAELMNASIRVTNKPGGGAVFTVEFDQ
jgi:signal transduction histidine kinase